MTVRIERPADRVARLVMDRPEALNALSTTQAEALTKACRELAADPALIVVVVVSALPRAFCVGADLKERNGFDDAAFAAQRPVLQQAFAALRELPVVTVAAVDGYALGGGCELALSCDLIVAGASATFGLPETGVGLVPGGGGTQLLSRRVGRGRAADLILTGRRLSGVEAVAWGLADRLVEPGTAGGEADDLARVIAARSPVALRAAKRALHLGADLELPAALEVEDQAWRTAAFSADRVEGIAAFTEHRAPRWPPPPRSVPG